MKRAPMLLCNKMSVLPHSNLRKRIRPAFGIFRIARNSIRVSLVVLCGSPFALLAAEGDPGAGVAGATGSRGPRAVPAVVLQAPAAEPAAAHHPHQRLVRQKHVACMMVKHVNKEMNRVLNKFALPGSKRFAATVNLPEDSLDSTLTAPATTESRSGRGFALDSSSPLQMSFRSPC